MNPGFFSAWGALLRRESWTSGFHGVTNMTCSLFMQFLRARLRVFPLQVFTCYLHLANWLLWEALLQYGMRSNCKSRGTKIRISLVECPSFRFSSLRLTNPCLELLRRQSRSYLWINQ